jgi:two-component system sensor histidine kinase/response regulator
VGAIDYISKPISPPIVMARVKTHLKLKHAYEELAQKNVALEEMAILRENVERITHHDLKTPLNGIINASALLIEDEELDQKTQMKVLKMIETASYNMLKMINSSLDLYKMETGVYQYNPEQVDILATIKKIIVETKSLAQENTLSVEILLNNKPIIQGDTFIVLGESLLCYSMLANLFKNALEASPQGSILTVFLDKKELATICIHNQGTIPQEIRETFFDKYATANKVGGTGLGTYSAKLMAEIQNGNIYFETSEKSGTSITVQLPK